MKSFAAILLLAATASADVTCDDCKKFGGAMQMYLMSESSIAEQTAILVATICPQLEDPAGCETGMNAHWGEIGAAMYPVFLDPGFVCGELGACKRSGLLVAEPTCDDCTGGVALVAELVSDAGTIAQIVDFLKGDDYCMGDATCGAYVDAVLPAAMPVLGAVLNEKAAEFCCNLSESGICC